MTRNLLFATTAAIGLVFAAPQALAVDVDALVGEILAEQGVPLELHQAFAEAVANPAEPLAVELDRPIVIGNTSPSFDVSDGWRRYYWALRNRLEEAGIPHEVSFQSASRHDAHGEQLAQVESMIASGVDYIVLGPTELDAQQVAIRQIHEAGIPLIIMNHSRRLDWDDQTLLYTAFDHEVGGVITGEWLNERLGGSGNLAFLRILPGDMDDQRFGGIMGMLEGGDYNVVDETFAHCERQRAFDAAESIMAAHPDLDMLVGLCSANAMGAAPAVGAMNPEVQVIGFGGTPDEVDAMLQGRMAGSVFRLIDDAGVAAAHAIQLHLEGREDEIPRVFTGEYVMIDDTWTQERVDEINIYAERYTKDAPLRP